MENNSINRRKHYTKDFKRQAVKFMLENNLSLTETTEKFRISNPSMLNKWFKKYSNDPDFITKINKNLDVEISRLRRDIDLLKDRHETLRTIVNKILKKSIMSNLANQAKLTG
ncbi:MAG: transposase [bacterium]